ncbi:MAG: methyltransferase domain-containing protein [candidate division WOR-3 bacterium]|nr:methyltransferase domain-containing protein [candidate division WOR-3 bacterium]
MNIEEYKKTRELSRRHFWYRQRERIIRFFMNKYSSACHSVLDTGCGTCPDMHIADNAIGMDMNINALKLCSRENLTVNADMLYMPFKLESFDIVWAMDVLQSNDINEEKALMGINRIIKPGGYFFINVPAYPSLYSAHDIGVNNARRYTRVQLKRLLSNYFDVLELHYWNFILMPAVIFKRKQIGIFSSTSNSDLRQIPKGLNSILNIIMIFEFALFKLNLLPAGVSIFTICRKR